SSHPESASLGHIEKPRPCQYQEWAESLAWPQGRIAHRVEERRFRPIRNREHSLQDRVDLLRRLLQFSRDLCRIGNAGHSLGTAHAGSMGSVEIEPAGPKAIFSTFSVASRSLPSQWRFSAAPRSYDPIASSSVIRPCSSFVTILSSSASASSNDIVATLSIASGSAITAPAPGPRARMQQQVNLAAGAAPNKRRSYSHQLPHVRGRAGRESMQVIPAFQRRYQSSAAMAPGEPNQLPGRPCKILLSVVEIREGVG